ncbi:NUDIX hydrolase [Nocardia panacis]|uniref:NUDIX hydrolase n=1 Tax=Nocardia panacis TaxID=2340916 RepID=A0A3A4K5J8_9NOCA|nr:NUDIX domain-containing protein [Nocardia panacis]RJO68190.1 NUDIX hydrolase [Nocardia panacis]
MVDGSLQRHLIAGAERDGIGRLVVGGVVECGATVLLLRRPQEGELGGQWELPGGPFDPAESIDRALRRAVSTATGLEPAEISTYLGQFDQQAEGEPVRHFTFVVRVAQAAPVPAREHAWVELTEEPPVTVPVRRMLDRYRAIRLPLGSVAGGSLP